jgi:molecular chaperone GrpE
LVRDYQENQAVTDPKATQSDPQADVTPNAKIDRKTDAADAAFEHVDQQLPESSNVSELEQLRVELSESQKRTLVAQAELENFRKRMTRERGEAIQYANANLLESLLPVLDNFEMGLKAARSESEDSMIYQGMNMVFRQCQDFLRDNGIETVEPAGDAFDPNLHEAVEQQFSDEVEEGHIITELRRGYRLRDRLLRAANVIVSKGKATDSESEGADEA